MIKKKVEIFTRRSFSEEFKRQCVLDYESGRFTVLELSRLHNVSFALIYRWIYRYSAYNKRKIKVVEMTESSERKIKDLYKRIEDLERIVGQKQLNIDFLEKMIELTKEQYGIDIKKNSNTLPSIGSEKTSKS
jgi:transposase-like protein